MTATLPAPGECPICRAMLAGGVADSIGRVWFTCGSAWREGFQAVRGDDCYPERRVVRA